MSEPSPDPTSKRQPKQFDYAGSRPDSPVAFVGRQRRPVVHALMDVVWMGAAAFAIAIIMIVILFGGQLARAEKSGVVLAALTAFVFAIAWATFVDRLRAAAAERTIALIEQAVRAGMPLSDFLRDAARTEPFLIARGVRAIHVQLQHGVPLAAAFAKSYPRAPAWLADALDVPPGGSLARSIAGLRARLEREHATQLFTLGRAGGQIGFTLVVSLVVLCYVLLYVGPRFLSVARDFGLKSPWVNRLQALERTVDGPWGVVLVLAALALGAIWVAGILARIASSRYGAPAGGFATRGSIAYGIGQLFSRIIWQMPVLGAQQRDVAWADFFGKLATQVSGALPLPDAVQAASVGASSSQLTNAANRVAAQLRSGQSFAAASQSTPGFPVVAAGLLASAANASQLASASRLLSDRFGERALRRAEAIRAVVPVVITLVMASAVCLFMLMLFVPITELIEISIPSQFKVSP